ncbi:dynein regulatory complex subunit 6 isoform X1 [Polypterus senegalus]|uniref:dynein regulatory complex subunit 6 isoform X1 n=1 Tax=Polypterus senegalus TaxID=55291 RepID=UPI00196534B4|nr:dynein regulatory complex subunit 6 isoform X1 [Polypterus senegalus]
METPDLPIEVITHILSYLQMSDRKEASLVCKKWYFASQDYQFQKKVTYKFPASSTLLDVISGLGRRPCYGIDISHLDGSSLSKAVLKQVAVCLGSQLESLSLRDSTITEFSFLAVLPHFSVLRSLDLSGSDSLFMSGTLLSKPENKHAVMSVLVNLQELNLSNLRYLSDLTFNRITECTPKLRKLCLAGCHITFEFDPYRGSESSCNSTAILSLKNIQRFLVKQASTIKELNLSWTGITPEALKSLVQVKGLCLDEIILQGCKDLTDQAIVNLCKLQPQLKSLDLSVCTELSSKSVLNISATLKDLQSLKLQKNWRITDNGLADLVQRKSFHTLDVSECNHITGSELVKGLSSPECGAKLISLNFSCCAMIKDITLFSLVQLVGPTLRVLDLTSCLYLTDLSVRAIASYLPGLAVLRMGWCKELTDWGLLGMVEPTEECDPDKEKNDGGPKFSRNFGNMGFFTPPKLIFDEKPRLVTENDLEMFKEQEGASLLALRGLQELDLTACAKLTNTSITKVIRFQDLRCLSLAMLNNITDSSLISVASHCRSLTRLNISHCSNLTDYGLTTAVRYLQRLQYLQIACCDKITDRFLSVLAQECKSLKSLDVCMCREISMAGIEQLQTELPTLENIKTRFVGGSDLIFSL